MSLLNRSINYMPKLLERSIAWTAKRQDLDLIKKAGWMSIEYIYKRRLLCLMHKVYYEKIDEEILNMFVVSRNESPQRRDNQITISERYMTNDQNTFVKRASKIWNAMPNELTNEKSYNVFRNLLPKFKVKIDKFSFVYNSYNISDDFIYF